MPDVSVMFWCLAAAAVAPLVWRLMDALWASFCVWLILGPRKRG